LGPTTLDELQRDVLSAFFRRESRYFLTGGAALAGFHLGHRRTQDLDLFTTESGLEDGVTALRTAAADLGATIESLRSSPDFQRFLVVRGSDSVVVDLVRDPAPQLFREKLLIGHIRVDPAAEILANKLCTLLSRAELKDLVDVWALERAGLSVEDALPGAALKDGGLTPGQLAWVLSQVEIGDDAVIPANVPAGELRRYLEELRQRLGRLAFPR
jgi:predicted nucleotidyltransferase component of viral defense system